MNADILKGRWMEIKGDVKRRWGKLTDNELEEIAGTEEMLLGHLQKSYGYAKEEAQRDYEEFMTSLNRGEPREPKKKARSRILPLPAAQRDRDHFFL